MVWVEEEVVVVVVLVAELREGLVATEVFKAMEVVEVRKNRWWQRRALRQWWWLQRWR